MSLDKLTCAKPIALFLHPAYVTALKTTTPTATTKLQLPAVTHA